MSEPIIWLKVFNEQEIHHEFKYRPGLNKLKEPFQKHGSCVPGGLYFTKAKYIDKFYSWGNHIRQITLPTDNPEFQMVKDPGNCGNGKKWRANMIILGDIKYPLSEVETYRKFGLEIDTG